MTIADDYAHDPSMSIATAQRQFDEVTTVLCDRMRECLRTPEGRETLRRELAALRGVHPSAVKLEGEP